MRHWLHLVFVLATLAASACAGGSIETPTPALDPLAARGKQIFTKNCSACHALKPGAILVGPSLAGVAGRADSRIPDLDARGYLELSILKPDAFTVRDFSDVMPKDFDERLTVEELDALVAFLLSLE